ncbi:MAG: helix-turn-helix domain-containing protein [Kofleriaceae bacterium]
MPRLTAEEGDPRVLRTRGALRDALAVLLRDRGFEDLTLNEIAEAAGLNRATIYKHYPDKFALLDAWVASDLEDRIYIAIVKAANCAEKVAAVISSTCECANHLRWIGRPEDRLLRPIVEARIRALVHTAIEFAIEQKIVRPVVKSDLAAAMAASAICGSAQLWRGGSDKQLATHVDKTMAALEPLIVPCATLPKLTKSLSFS